MGTPLRVTIGPRGLEKGIVEVRARAGGETDELPIETAGSAIADRVGAGR